MIPSTRCLHQRCRTLHRLCVQGSSRPSLSTTAAASKNNQIEELKQKQVQAQLELALEAASITKSFYRTCLRSVRLIRPGNEHDEKDFVERENKRLDDQEDSIRTGVFSMLPPVNREDELRSRADYYLSYARENIFQESDCFPDHIPWSKHHLSRFVHYLEKGENDRKWLLKDMKFSDPYEDSFPTEQIKAFQERFLAFLEGSQEIQSLIGGSSATTKDWIDEIGIDYESDSEERDDEDGFDDRDDEMPSWMEKKFPQVSRK